MTFVVTENCIKCKYTDCVDVCPVDCFYEGPDMLVINPDECIDCAVCEPECPANAIVPASQLSGPMLMFKELNHQYSSQWTRMTAKKEPMPDADTWNGAPDKKRFLNTA